MEQFLTEEQAIIDNSVYQGIQLIFEEIKKNQIFGSEICDSALKQLQQQTKIAIETTIDTLEKYVEFNFFESEEVEKSKEQDILNKEYNKTLIQQAELQKQQYIKKQNLNLINQVQESINKQSQEAHEHIEQQLKEINTQNESTKILKKIEKCKRYISNAQNQLQTSSNQREDLLKV